MLVDWEKLCSENVKKVRDAMAATGLDALVLTKNETTRYTTGYQRYYCSTYLPFVHMVVLFQDRGPYLVLPEHIVSYGERCHAESVHVLPLGMKAQVRALADSLRSVDRQGCRIGVELDYVHGNFLRLFEGELQNAQVVDATPMLEKAMAVKSAAEISLIRKSSALCDEVVRSIFDKATPGVTELELAACAESALRKGAEFINHLCVRSEENAFDLSPINTDRALREGDCLQLDIGVIYEGYVSDMNRTLVLGEASRDKADIIRTVVDVHWALADLIKPGNRACDVYNHALALFGRSDLGEHFRMPFIGHGLGLNLHEYPYITPDNEAVFEPGMVIALEPGLYAPGRGTCRMENVLLVTEAGNELITDLPDDRELNKLN